MFRPIMAIIRFLYRLRGVYISECVGVDVEISMHQFPVALLSSANSYGQLTLRQLMSYIYGAPSKARNANVVYIWTYVWQR